MSQNPLLSFEFAGADGKITPVTFENPLKFVVAHSIDEVFPCFQQIEEAVSNGYFAAGFLSYESAPAFDSAFRVKGYGTMPLLWFGIYSKPLHQPIRSHEGMYSLTEWIPSVSIDKYHECIEEIKQAIENGDTYQTNYTIRLNSQFEGDDIAFFEQLKRAQASNYCAYINTGDHSILSASPELFFHLKGSRIITRPMKGTTKRGKTFTEDTENASWLYHSEKNRAENVMIVDLLRNDLGVIAKTGTVTVPKLFEMEQYPTVHQMTSTISADVSDEMKIVDIFKALFPCGSITGAPKISTMNIIANLETMPREVYCGAIGYITPEREAIFNVPIRTVLIEQSSGKATYGVGGGITWDSTTTDEYHEVLAKASFLKVERPRFQLLEGLLLEDGAFYLLEEHLERLKKSASYFGFPVDMDLVRKELQRYGLSNNVGIFKVRLLVGDDGATALESQAVVGFDAPLKVIIADKSIDSNHVFLYHKTTNRAMYEEFQREKPAEVFDVLLWNESGELTEFTNGNVILELEGELYTPPVESGLLAGTFRNRLIKTGVIQERTLSKEDLKQSSKMWFINSVRKWVEVELIKQFQNTLV